MKDKIQIILIAIIVVLLIACFYLYKTSNNNPDFIYNYLDGLWIADDEFCKKSGIDGIMVYIVPTDNAKIKKASLIMHTNNNIVENKVITLNFEDLKNKDYENVKLNLEIESETEIDYIMPDEQTVTLNITTGTMTWENDDTQYAVLIKDNLSVM